jgi:hypothetical protein
MVPYLMSLCWTLGYPALVPPSREGRRYLHNQRLGKVVPRDRAVVDLQYIHYLLCSQEYRHEVFASATGTTVKHTSPERCLARFDLDPRSLAGTPTLLVAAVAHRFPGYRSDEHLNRAQKNTAAGYSLRAASICGYSQA